VPDRQPHDEILASQGAREGEQTALALHLLSGEYDATVEERRLEIVHKYVHTLFLHHRNSRTR